MNIPPIRLEIMRIEDTLQCDWRSREELFQLREERGLNCFVREGQKAEEYLALCKEILARHRTTDKFKVGDKVYVDPGKPTFAFENYIRATVTEIDKGKWGYHLRAFQQDLPGIYMFNIWDKDLSPRIGKANKRLPEDYLVKN